MKKYERDVLTIILAANFLKGTGKNLNNFIPDFEQTEFSNLESTLLFLSSDEKFEKVFGELVNDSYKRIKEKYISR